MTMKVYTVAHPTLGVIKTFEKNKHSKVLKIEDPPIDRPTSKKKFIKLTIPSPFNSFIFCYIIFSIWIV